MACAIADPVPAPDVVDVLDSAGLRYSSDRKPGLRREGSAPSFRYVDGDGKGVDDERTLARIRRLAIPPAWTDVWICTDPRGHLQATGRDARGRKQYRYHERWRAERDDGKFGRLGAFARALPAIRRAVERDLALPGLPRAKVVAAMVALLDRTAVRVGSDEYRKENGTYGLSTLRNRHADVKGESIRLRFRGKAGKEHDITLDDRRLAAIVRRCKHLPGYELFQYVEAGAVRSVDAADVNAYVKDAGGDDYTAKDFRTWNATVIAASALACAEPPSGDRAAAKVVNDAIRCAAEALGNTPAVCRKSYVHPDVLDCARAATIAQRTQRRLKGLSRDEVRTLAMLDAANRAARRQGDIAGALAASLRRRAKAGGRGQAAATTRGAAAA
ncbi:MAG TPA: DNA topoisomerase IB [Casimicrobiaceae bacterium]|nr:DNA topoisomerase IB [Casimicrobiaceae bacterium]